TGNCIGPLGNRPCMRGQSRIGRCKSLELGGLGPPGWHGAYSPMIQRGNPVPNVGIKLVTADGMSDTTSGEVLGKGVVVLFSVPGAFTPTCHVNHLPSFLANSAKL